MPPLATLCWLALVPAAAVDASKVDALVAAALREWDVPGAAVVIVAPEGIRYLKGHGVRDAGRKDPVTPDTLFPLASCSKAFTTALVGVLADEGKLSWDDPVRKHLPDFRLSDRAADALVSLRDLASHRSGLAGHDLLWYRAPWSQEEMIRKAGKLPLSRPFRTEMQYQSVMYVALGHAAARAGGKPWEELVHERLLKPLVMSGVTLTTIAAMKQSDRASGHRLGNDGKLAVVPWYEQKEPNPAGSVNASARDLAPWLRLHLNGGKCGDEQIVSEAALSETHTPHAVVRVEGPAAALSPDTHQTSYGLGWVVQDYRGRLVVQHAGLIDGFRVHLTLLPKDGFAFAILANRQGTRMNLALSNSLVDLLLGLPKKDWNKYLLGVMADEAEAARVQARRIELDRKPDTTPSVPLDDLAGIYEDAAYGPATIRNGKDGLVWEWGSWKVPLEHFAYDTFRLKSDDERLNGAFVQFRVKDGRPREFRLLGVTYRRSEN